MPNRLPIIVVSGASGFIGRNFLDTAAPYYRIYALARRSQYEARVPEHPNITWIQVDIANWPMLKAVTRSIKQEGGADFVLHLAGFYDFTYEDNPEYVRTNVNGTRHMLELAKWLCVKRFIFASSLAACPFPGPGERIDEETPPDAGFPYAWSKKEGERLTREYAAHFPCTVVRFAAVFSDWCEYAPLYAFLSTWLSKRWNNRVVAGDGSSSCAYIHVRDLTALLLKVLRDTAALPDFGVYAATGEPDASHLDLFRLATRFYFGKPRRPLFIPVWIAWPGVVARDLLGRLIGRRPFERPWMLRYVGMRMRVDAARTRRELGWEPAPRHLVLRRLLFLIERMRSRPEEWRVRNEAALERVTRRPNFLYYEELSEARETILDRFLARLMEPASRKGLEAYQDMDPEDLWRALNIFFDLLLASIRTQDRTLLLDYVAQIAEVRREAGFLASHMRNFLSLLAEVTVLEGLRRPRLSGFAPQFADQVRLSLQLASDEAEEAFARSDQGIGPRGGRVDAEARIRAARELEAMIHQLNVVHGDRTPTATNGERTLEETVRS